MSTRSPVRHSARRYSAFAQFSNIQLKREVQSGPMMSTSPP